MNLSQLRSHSFLLLAVLAAPVLLFSPFLPAWAPPATVGVLALASLLRMARRASWGGSTPVDAAALLLALTLPLGLWASTDHTVTLPRTYAFVGNLALFWAVAEQRDADWLRWSGWGLLAGGLALSGLTLLGTQFGEIAPDLQAFLPTRLRLFWNPAGFNPNLTGGLLALLVPPAVMLALRGRGWGQRLLAALTAALLLCVIYLAQSRGALLGLTFALPVITILLSARWRWFWWLAVALLGVLLLGAAAFGAGSPSLDALLGQSAVLGSSSLQGRLELWSRAIAMSRDFPLTGVGMGMFQHVVQLFYPTFFIAPTADVRHPHNLYLQLAAEMGFPGLIAHLALFFALGWLLWRQARQRDAGVMRDTSLVALGLLGSLIVYCVHGLVDVIAYAPRAAILVWGLFGLMAAVGASSRQRET